MTKQQANLILDQVKVGIPHPTYLINLALTVTGDLKPWNTTEQLTKPFHTLWNMDALLKNQG